MKETQRMLALCACVAAIAALAAPPVAGAESTVTLRPASGPAGTHVLVAGRGFHARERAVVKLGRKTLARSRTGARGSFQVSFVVPETSARKLDVVSRAGRRSVTNLYRVSGAAGALATSEVASQAGARLRWAPSQGSVGSILGLQGSGFPSTRKMHVSFGGTPPRVARTSRKGSFSTELPVPSLPATDHKISVRSASTTLAFDFRIVAAPPSPPVGSVGLPQPPPATEPTTSPAQPPLPTPQPAFPIRAAFYYPWFPEAWSQNGITPFTKYQPTLSSYHSDDQTIRRSHLRSLEYGKFEAAIYSWWGQGHYTDNRFPAMLADTNATGSPLKWALYHEAEGYADPTVAEIGSDLDYVKSKYASDPSYLKVGDKPVMFVYARGADGCPMADRWVQANTASRGFYLVLKVFLGYKDCASKPDSWHQYAPSTRADRQAGYSFAISPEFDLTGPEPERLPRDLAAFQQAATSMVASNDPWQLVISFNEWGENTATESATIWSSASGHGQYLDVLAGL